MECTRVGELGIDKQLNIRAALIRIGCGACSAALLGTGAEAWKDTIHGIINSPADLARAVAVDTDGNVAAAGQLQATDTTTAFTVIKFDGATGTEHWRQVITSTIDGARAVALDAGGDVVAAGDSAR